MTDPDQRTSMLPDTDLVRDVLTSIRYDRSLADSPLVRLNSVWQILQREGVAPSREGQAWALGTLVHELVGEQLEAARRSAAVVAPDSDASRSGLRTDFAADSADLEAWSAVYHRYMHPGQLQSGEIASGAGLSRRTLSRRLATGVLRLAEVLAAREREAARQLALPAVGRDTSASVEGGAGVTLPAADVDAAAVARVGGDAATIAGVGGDAAAGSLRPGDLLFAWVHAPDRPLPLPPATLEQLAIERPGDLRSYLLARVAAWSLAAHQPGARFVDLTVLLDRGEDAQQRWQTGAERFDGLGAVFHAVDATAVVLLGPPGSGKSTLLRRLELDVAMAGLRGDTATIPFLVSLGRYWTDGSEAEPLAPSAWLAQIWDRRHPDLPRFDGLLAERRLLLLLDGLNEMQHASLDDYRRLILAWKRFLQSLDAEYPGVRVVVACRSLDYGAPLSSPELRVPQARIEPMSDEQVRRFLHCYAPAQADAIWVTLEGTPQLDLVRNPYLLKLLLEQAVASGDVPVGRAALFTSFIRRAMRREIERDNPLFQPGALIDERDYRRTISAHRWPSPSALPERGALLPGLTALAFGIQERFADGRSAQARVDFDTALHLIGQPGAADVVRAGEALAVLEEHHGRDEVLFTHQLQLEYFAARRLASDPEGAALRVRRALRASDVTPTIDQLMGELGAGESLPALPATEWEEIVLLAASMSDDPTAFVEALSRVDLPLAGRAAAQPELVDVLSPSFLTTLRQVLAEMGSDEGFELRARMEAGLALGRLGDPRFELRSGGDGPFLEPPMVTVPEGSYMIGDDSGTDPGSSPTHTVRLGPFEIGRFPVTNAEWSHFMASGGYDDERWWDTADARAWRRGELTAQGSRRWVRDWLAKMRADPDLVDELVVQGMAPEHEEMWRKRLAMDADELQTYLEWKYPQRRFTAPLTHDRSRAAGPTQPVTGISWYEARAYCLWLSAQSGSMYRLPTEIEWEAAARGGDDRRYPWGDAFTTSRCNAFPSRLGRAAPVGVMPSGRAPCGAEMLSGDVKEWTVSLWGEDADRSAFPYPYRAGDGREQADAPSTVHRVHRGGSFLDSDEECLAFARRGVAPDTRFHCFGMRLARPLG